MLAVEMAGVVDQGMTMQERMTYASPPLVRDRCGLGSLLFMRFVFLPDSD